MPSLCILLHALEYSLQWRCLRFFNVCRMTSLAKRLTLSYRVSRFHLLFPIFPSLVCYTSGIWLCLFLVLLSDTGHSRIHCNRTGSSLMDSTQCRCRKHCSSGDWKGGESGGSVRVVQIGLRARIGKCAGFRKDKWDLASTCKKLRPFDCPVSPWFQIVEYVGK